MTEYFKNKHIVFVFVCIILLPVWVCLCYVYAIERAKVCVCIAYLYVCEKVKRYVWGISLQNNDPSISKTVWFKYSKLYIVNIKMIRYELMG